MLNRILPALLNREAARSLSGIREVLTVSEGQTVADLGSGGGLFTLEFARSVGQKGKVYAVDVESWNLAYVKRKAGAAGLTDRIILVLAEENDSLLPQGEVDLLFSRNSFHHLKTPETYFRRLRSTLKPGGRIVIIDHDGGRRLLPRMGHSTPADTIQSTLKQAGLVLKATYDILPGESFQIFQTA